MPTPEEKTAKRPDPPLKTALIALRNADPRAFQDFVNELATYTYECSTAAVFAPQTEILTQQGRAQQCHAFLRMSSEILQNV